MKWQIEYLEKDGIVSAAVSGQTTIAEHLRFTQEVVTTTSEHNTCNIFLDLKQMVPDLSVLDILRMPEILEKAGVKSYHKMAVLFDYSSPFKSNFDFFGSVTSLKPLNIRTFRDKDSAIKWLTETRTVST